ncbi:MAG: hypothetical protein PVH54_03955 [Gammaproteobacteria bacterium]
MALNKIPRQHPATGRSVLTSAPQCLSPNGKVKTRSVAGIPANNIFTVYQQVAGIAEIIKKHASITMPACSGAPVPGAACVPDRSLQRPINGNIVIVLLPVVWNFPA